LGGEKEKKKNEDKVMSLCLHKFLSWLEQYFFP